MKNNRTHTARYIALVSVFTVICVAYIIMLAVIQHNGTKVDDNKPASVKTFTVAGLRGEIYDRNGVLLVGNSTSYDMMFEYGSMPDTHTEINKAILAALDALELNGEWDKLCSDYYVLEGTYPDFKYCDAVEYTDSDECRYLQRILDANGLDTKNTSPEQLANALMKKYKIYEDMYSPEQITKLLMVRYCMERVQFGYYQPYTLAKDVSMNLITYIEEAKIDGVTFKINSERVYTYPGYASHILGRVGKISGSNAEYYSALGYPMDAVVGTSGCEEAFESYLHGQNGTLVIEYDSDGNIIRQYYETEPISGNDVWLTIDINLQIAAEDGLKENTGSIQSADAGAAVAMDPDAGAILAIASYPTYDLTQFDSIDYYNSLLNDETKPLYNRAMLGTYAPGSVYKIGVALAALETGTITPDTLINCDKIYPHFQKPTCLGTHGYINVREAIKVSCNCFFYEIGRLIGIDEITKYTSALGLGVSTGVELSESEGIIAGPAYRQANELDDWTPGNDIIAAIGQSDHCYTPLQLSVYLSTIVNGGTRHGAHLLDSVHKFYTGEVIYKTETPVLDTVNFSSSTHSLLLDSMRSVVTNSSELSSYFAGLPVQVAGKTGTAEVDGQSQENALFACYAPYGDKPEIVISCVIEKGVKGSNAAITAKKILEEYYKDK